MYSQSYGFSSSRVQMWESEHKAECWITNAFELWSWRRLLRVPSIARRSNQSILKEINLEYSSEVLMLKLQYFGHLMWRLDSLEKTLMLERLRARGEGGNSGWDGCMTSVTQQTWVWANSERVKTGNPDMLQSIEQQRMGHDLATEQQCRHSFSHSYKNWLFKLISNVTLKSHSF